MAIGPFPVFSFPGPYTETKNEAPTATAAGALRFPAFIGVADEVNRISDYEMVRGSSSIADNPVVREDVSSQLTGTNRNFTVTYYPIVRGDGNGTVTTDPMDVRVYVNGEPVPVASVNGTTGEIYLVNIPLATDNILASYYFKRSDTLYSAEDLSIQADGTNKNFKVQNVPIVDGSNGGITTTDPTKVAVTVNAVAAVVSAVDGDSGIITLASAPAAGAVVLVTYYSNELQDTSDLLPSPYVTQVTRVGLSPGTSDYIQNTDFVLDTSGNFSTLNWGHSYKIAAGQTLIGTTPLNSTQISVTLYDNRMFRRPVIGTVDGTNKTFTLEAIPRSGQGLGYDTDNPTLVTAFVGASAADATAAAVLSMSAAQRTVTLATAPAAGNSVYVTEYINLLADDVWTITNTVAGASGVGQYTMAGANSGTALDVQWSAADTTVAGFNKALIQYPSGSGDGNRDTQIRPGFAAEDITLTFVSATSYVVTSSIANGTGSNGDNTGYLNQTYSDKRTGFAVTLVTADAGSYTTNDVIGYTVSPTFIASDQPTRAIPGARMILTSTEGVGVENTAIVTTYNKSGNEPRIGDFYYVTFDETKTDIGTAKFFTVEKDALRYTGPLSATNKLGMALHLAFLNGAPAIALVQIARAVGGEDAGDSAYIAAIDVFDEPMEGGVRPALLEPVTTSSAVLSYLKISNITQAGIRYRNERMSYFGFPLNTSPSTAITFAKSMASERMIAVYPDGAITTITDALGNDVEYLYDGAMLAAALSGRDTSPAFDVAEPLTNKPVVGFRRLYRRMDSITQAQVANSGITLLEEQAAGIVVKIDLTTDLASPLTRTPSIIRIKDFVQKGTRSVLQPYIGMKNLDQRTSEIETTLGSYLSALKQAQIIRDFTGIKAVGDPNDPTIINVEATYQPIFPLLWIVVTFNLRSKL